MSFWRDLIVLTAVVLIASLIVGNLLALAVTQMYPDIELEELHGRVNAVLACLTVLGLVWHYRRCSSAQPNQRCITGPEESHCSVGTSSFSIWWHGTPPTRLARNPGNDRGQRAPPAEATLPLIHVTYGMPLVGTNTIADALTRPVIAASPKRG
jgi:hypothetical protein